MLNVKLLVHHVTSRLEMVNMVNFKDVGVYVCVLSTFNL